MVAFAGSSHPNSSAASVLSMSRSRAEAAREDLERWVMSPQALALPVHELEVEQERRSREMQRLWLQTNLEARGASGTSARRSCGFRTMRSSGWAAGSGTPAGWPRSLVRHRCSGSVTGRGGEKACIRLTSSSSFPGARIRRRCSVGWCRLRCRVRTTRRSSGWRNRPGSKSRNAARSRWWRTRRRTDAPTAGGLPLTRF